MQFSRQLAVSLVYQCKLQKKGLAQAQYGI